MIVLPDAWLLFDKELFRLIVLISDEIIIVIRWQMALYLGILSQWRVPYSAP